MNLYIPIKKLREDGLPLPAYATSGSVGMDLYASIEQSIIIAPNSTAFVPTGIAIALPENFEAQIRPRSGLAAKNQITVLNTPGTIDSDYRGEIMAIIINHGKVDFEVTAGMRIAQMIIAPVVKAKFELVDELTDTVRGQKGFGSTGVKEALPA